MPRATRLYLAALLSSTLVALSACGGDSDSETTLGASSTGAASTSTAASVSATASQGGTSEAVAAAVVPASSDFASLVAARPYKLVAPADLDGDELAPLLLVLHPYGGDAGIEGYFDLGPVAGEHGVVVAYPKGTTDSSGRAFWNATNVCCDFDGTGVDDVAYLNAVIDDVASKHVIDAKRVFVIGQSNGAFMAHRLACDSADRIAAVVATSGANWAGNLQCKPSEPVAVLQVQGDADDLVRYGGGALPYGPSLYPSAHESIAGWARNNGCGAAIEAVGEALDIESVLAGAETSVERYAGCEVNGAAELWSVHAGEHVMRFSPAFAELAWEFLEGHAKE